MINIAICFDDNFVMPAGVLLTSVCISNNTNEITFYIISDSLSDINKKNLKLIADKYNKNIIFIDITLESLKDFPINLSNFTLATYYRILLPQVLPENIGKILYLDCDMLVVDNLSDFYNTDITAYSTAIVPDMFYDDESITNRLLYPVEEHYYNAGMLLINIDYWRKNKISEKTINFIINHKELCVAHDQDAINAVLHGTIYNAPFRYNVQLDFFKKKTKMIFKDNSEIKAANEAAKNPCIIHYTGPSKPWKYQSYNPFEPLWYYFQDKTIWKDLPKVHEFHGFKLFKWTIKHILEKLHLRHKRINEYEDLTETIRQILEKFNK